MIRRTSVGRLRREAGDAIGVGPCVKPGRTVQVARLWMGWDGMEWYGMVYGLRLVWVFEIWREGDGFVCTHDLSINLSPGETIASTLSLGPAAILCCPYMYGVLHTKCPELPRWARMPSTAMVLVCPREHRVLHVSGSMCNCETGAK